ncbi:MAG: hypothetical protein ACP5NL_07765, partial [Thermoplasmata archaeon]
SISYVPGNTDAFRYSFSGEIAGNYTLFIEGDNAFYSNGIVPTMTFAGIPYQVPVTLNGHTVNSIIPGKMIEPFMIVVYHGPYMDIPQIMPSFTIALNPPHTPYEPYVISGGIMFLALILITFVVLRRW